MYRGWPFFRMLIDNAQLSLGQADLAVARLYAGLARPELARQVFEQVEREWAATEFAIKQIAGIDEVLANSPVLRRSIRLRNPYVDPLSFVQVSLLRRLHTLPDDAEERPILEQLAALSINGVAAGLQNTG
jgi:phosphoenolpyruvate carboxylase